MYSSVNRLIHRFSTIFDKILAKQIPSQAVYEDQLLYAFKDINPQAPVHILIIPKNKDGLTGISKATDKHNNILGYLFSKIPLIAQQNGLTQGYRLVINEGNVFQIRRYKINEIGNDGQQTVNHLHVHLLGGRQMKWPPG